MALHSDTDIYKAVVELAAFALRASRGMPRDVKQLIGASIIPAAAATALSAALDRLEDLPERPGYASHGAGNAQYALEKGMGPMAHLNGWAPLAAADVLLERNGYGWCIDEWLDNLAAYWGSFRDSEHKAHALANTFGRNFSTIHDQLRARPAYYGTADLRGA